LNALKSPATAIAVNGHCTQPWPSPPAPDPIKAHLEALQLLPLHSPVIPHPLPTSTRAATADCRH
jgi:hypothetical protein